MRGAVVVVMLAGCGFSLELGDNTAGDAAPDTAMIDAAPDGPKVECPASYTAIGTSMYTVLTPTNFKNQSAACLSHRLGSTHLAVIDDQQELMDLLAYGNTVTMDPTARFYVGVVQAPDQTEPENTWIDFSDRDVDPALWSQSGTNEPNDGTDDNENNHQEQVAAIRLGSGALIDLAHTENVRAICECDGNAMGLKAAAYILPPNL